MQDYHVKTIDYKQDKIKLQIWDTAGEEKHESLTSIFYKDANAIIFAYDITSLKSFEKLNEWI